MKYLAPFEVAQMLSEGIIDSFYWGTPEKEQAEKFVRLQNEQSAVVTLRKNIL